MFSFRDTESRPEIQSEKYVSRPGTPSERSVWQTPTDDAPMLVPIPSSVKLEPVSTTRPSREPLEQVVDGDFRKHLALSMPLYESGKWKYEFQMSSFTTTILKLLFAEA